MQQGRGNEARTIELSSGRVDRRVIKERKMVACGSLRVMAEFRGLALTHRMRIGERHCPII